MDGQSPVIVPLRLEENYGKAEFCLLELQGHIDAQETSVGEDDDSMLIGDIQVMAGNKVLLRVGNKELWGRTADLDRPVALLRPSGPSEKRAVPAHRVGPMLIPARRTGDSGDAEFINNGEDRATENGQRTGEDEESTLSADIDVQPWLIYAVLRKKIIFDSKPIFKWDRL